MNELRLERHDDGVAMLTLNRPEKRNALSIEMRFELATLLEALAADPDVGCLLVTGAGSAFCAGMDVTQFGGDLDNRRRIVDSSIAAFGGLGRFPKPAVAAGEGPGVPRGGPPPPPWGQPAAPPPTPVRLRGGPRRGAPRRAPAPRAAPPAPG